MNFFCILPSIVDIAAVKPNGANTFLVNGNATFINGPANLLNNLPKNPPDCIIFFICALLNFISVAELLLRAFLNLVFCLVVNNNSGGVSFLLKFLKPNLNVAPSLDLTAFLIYLIVHSLICNLLHYIQPLLIRHKNYLIYFNSSFLKF